MFVSTSLVQKSWTSGVDECVATWLLKTSAMLLWGGAFSKCFITRRWPPGGAPGTQRTRALTGFSSGSKEASDAFVRSAVVLEKAKFSSD